MPLCLVRLACNAEKASRYRCLARGKTIEFSANISHATRDHHPPDTGALLPWFHHPQNTQWLECPLAGRWHAPNGNARHAITHGVVIRCAPKQASRGLQTNGNSSKRTKCKIHGVHCRASFTSASCFESGPPRVLRSRKVRRAQRRWSGNRDFRGVVQSGACCDGTA